MEFLASLPTFGSDLPAKTVFNWFSSHLKNVDGVCYYKYPILGPNPNKPDLTVITRIYQPVIVRCVPYALNEILSVDNSGWVVRSNGTKTTIDSPELEVDDFGIALQQRFDRERMLRRRFKPQTIVALPLCGEVEFLEKLGRTVDNGLWAGGESVDVFFNELHDELSDAEWRLTRSVLQAAVPIHRASGPVSTISKTLGTAVKRLEAEIALLDEEQQKVAIQIPPGPQRIRGLAGTGKTVLLAMKAANIHHHFPDCNVLFTFHTQSLYNQSKNLISKFYRFYSDVDPDWTRLHIRHAWGGKYRPGVYYDLSLRQGVTALNFRSARALDPAVPFRACCSRALEAPITQEYDYILVDEAQDFPQEFFPILFQLSKPPHAVYFAYDELQSLSSIEMPNPSELFGKDEKGQPRVSLDVEFEDGMDRDLVLHKSYRCPQQVLMLAHGIGLGIHNPRRPVQMLADENSWRAIGYVLESGELKKGSRVVLYRPPENSPNRIAAIYGGKQPFVVHEQFKSRNDELQWIANAIKKDIHEEGISPEQIVVISLDSKRARDYMVKLQELLFHDRIASTIPGLIDDSAEFAEQGQVTLSTVHRAKGNEAPVVYIFSFESLYEFAEEIENRNRAFTAISRSKGWVRITGVGTRMESVIKEVKQIMTDIPRFRFTFPDMEKIRRLDASETTRRRLAVRRAKEAVESLKLLDEDAIADLNPEDLKRVARLLQKVQK